MNESETEAKGGGLKIDKGKKWRKGSLTLNMKATPRWYPDGKSDRNPRRL